MKLWTPEERLDAVGRVLNYLRSKAMRRDPDRPGDPNHEAALMIALAPAEFLNSSFCEGMEEFLKTLRDGQSTVAKIVDYAEGRGPFVGPQ